MWHDPEYETEPATRQDKIWWGVACAAMIIAGIVSWYVST